MADVDARCNFFGQFGGADCCLEIMFLATLQTHRHRKLAQLLCEVSIEVTKRLKDGPVSVLTVKDLGEKYASIPQREAVNKIPKFCSALWTGTPTQKIGKALGFQVYLRIPFTEFSYDGKTYSERVGADVWCEAAGILV